jgi:hypothetical protein
VAEHFPGTKIQPSGISDLVQKDAKNEPDIYILQYWKPEIDLKLGIANIVKHMTLT